VEEEAQLQAALLHHPEHVEAHLRLASRLLTTRRGAVAREDAAYATLTARRVEAHLQRLPEDVAAPLRARLAGGDPLESLRRGRGAFVGRAGLLAALRERLSSSRWVSLVGPPGVGKTRLALELAGGGTSEVLFADLTEALDADGVVRLVGRALDVPLTQRDPVTQLGHALRSRSRMLLVLDNLEQVAEAACPLRPGP